MQYSTKGYGILGEVICHITGKKLNKLVKERIGKPVIAKFFCAWFWFTARGASVYSTIEDMARFSIGVINQS